MPTSAAPLTTGRSRRRARNSFSSSSSSSVVGGTISSLGLVCSSDIFPSISCGFGGGGFLSRFSPRGGAFVGDQSPAADLHDARSPSLSPHLVEHVFRDAVRRAEFAKRHGERRSANRGLRGAGDPLRLDVRRRLYCARIGNRRSWLALGRISRHQRLTAGNFSTRHRCRLPKLDGARYGRCLIFPKGRSGETGELLVDQKSDQISNLTAVRLVHQLAVNPLS